MIKPFLNKRRYWFLAGIVLLAFFLRFYRLGAVPPSLDWDEAALGYNAYSLLETGRDEYGVRWPLVFRSFDDYKPPLYFYLTMPAVKLFGLTAMAVRLPSAFFGTLTVLVTFFLVAELFRKNNRYGLYLPFVVSFLLAISPWHIYFSRIAFEANVGVFFNVLGVWLFLRALRKSPFLLLPAAAVFALGLYEYHSERIFLPVLVICLAVIFGKQILLHRKALLLSLLTGLVMVLPLVRVLVSPDSLTRLKGTSAYADQTGVLSRNIIKLENAQKTGDWLGYLFANRRITYAQILINGYLSHFNFNWLFVSGDQERHKAPGIGLLYWFELPLFLYGLYSLAWSREKRRTKALVFAWFLIAPLAASPTTEVPHAVRTLVFLPTFQIFTAFGLVRLLAKLKQRLSDWRFFPAVIILGAIFAFNFFYLTHQYFVHLPREFSKYWQYGYQQAVEYVQKHYDEYDRIVVSTQLEQPHIFFLFFLKYPPEKYLAQGGTVSGGFEEYRNAFDKFIFKRIAWESEVRNNRTLFIGPPGEIPGDGDFWIDYLDGSRAIEIKNGGGN